MIQIYSESGLGQQGAPSTSVRDIIHDQQGVFEQEQREQREASERERQELRKASSSASERERQESWEEWHGAWGF